MRKQIKLPDSPILIDNLKYETTTHRDRIRRELKLEQKNFCAYSELYLGDYDGSGKNELSPEIEHFNPTLKDTPNDSYHNWFLVIRTLNQSKSHTWIEPILHPTAEDFEARVVYEKNTGIYIGIDEEAENLVKLLGLNVEWLRAKRVRYIKNRKVSMAKLGQTPEQYFHDLLEEEEPEPIKVYFIRAIEEEFGIKLNL